MPEDVVVAQAESGLVAIEWATAGIDPSFLQLSAHAALLTIARREAQRLGLRPSTGGAVVYTVRRGEATEALRFVWGEATDA
jgi:hypothetical protein